MNIRSKLHMVTVFDREADRNGVGANALWSGPLDTTGFPKGKGNSSGIKGMILNNDKPICQYGPITKRAKGRF
jgi:hypothetical protein